MKQKMFVLLAGLVTLAGAAFAQQQPADPVRTPGAQAGRDPNRDAFIMKNCKAPAPTPAPAGPPPGQRPPQSAQFENAPIAGIPGVVAPGQRWRKVWQGSGNNTDSPIATDKGILLAQNDLNQIAEIGLDGIGGIFVAEQKTKFAPCS